MSAPAAAPSPTSSASSGPGWAARFLGDDYVWKARKAPILLVTLPAFFAAVAWIGFSPLLAVIPASVGCLLLGCCGHFGRILGALREPKLWQSWGGKPTTRMLRHRETPFSAQKLALLHSKLAAATRIKAPTAAQENKKPKEADKIYEDFTTHLRHNTRDRNHFPLVREELVNYGFARNVWGLRPVGLSGALLSLGAIGVRAWWGWKTGASSEVVSTVVPGFLTGAILFFWIFWAREAWVKKVAEAYAARLLEAAESLLPNSSS